jgi:hypothetical protein
MGPAPAAPLPLPLPLQGWRLVAAVLWEAYVALFIMPMLMAQAVRLCMALFTANMDLVTDAMSLLDWTVDWFRWSLRCVPFVGRTFDWLVVTYIPMLLVFLATAECQPDQCVLSLALGRTDHRVNPCTGELLLGSSLALLVTWMTRMASRVFAHY